MTDIAFAEAAPAAPDTASEPDPAPVATPAAIVAMGPAPTPSRLLLLAVSLAAFASVISASGLIVAGRTVNEAKQAIAMIAAHAPAPAPVHAQEPAPADHAAERMAVAAVLPGHDRAATVGDVRAALTDLRRDLARYQGSQNQPVLSAMQDGQSELANRLAEMALKLDRIDRSLSSSRPAKP